MPQQISTNTFGCAEWVVSSDATQGTHTTIQAAINAASSGDSVFIRTGTYTENLTLKAGVDLTAFGCDSSINATGHVIILGTCTLTTAGTVTISGIQLQTNGAALLAVTGSAASVVNLENCYLNMTNNTGITFSSSSSSAAININNTNGNLGTTGIAVFSHSSVGSLFFYETDITNTGGSTTASTASSGSLFIRRSAFESPITTSSTNAISFYTSQIYTQPQNVTAFTCGGSGTNVASNSIFQSGTATAISVGSTLNIALSNIASSNTNAIAGAGTITYSDLAFSSTSSKISTTTQVGGVAQGGLTQAPSAGFIGEQITSFIGVGSAVTLGSTTPANVTSISLTPGIWNVVGLVMFNGGVTAANPVTVGSISVTSATNGTSGNGSTSLPMVSSANIDLGLTIPDFRVTLTATTTYYLVAQMNFTGGTGKAYGRISATRVG